MAVPISTVPNLSPAAGSPDGGFSAHTDASALDAAQAAELARLAFAILCKSPDDLAALTTVLPAMPATWIEAFATERARAEAEAKFWSAAIAYLVASAPGTAANDE